MVSVLAPLTRHIQHTSYLYPGFRAVEFLPSIRRQRTLQSLVLKGLSIESVVFAGCGFGDEMVALLSNGLEDARMLLAIDIADVGADVERAGRQMGRPVSFVDCDLLDLDELPGCGSFDLLQAGFVLHDLTDEEKDEAFAVVARVLKRRGYFLVSDFFPGDLSTADIYGRFINEAETEVRALRMPSSARDEFFGDGETPGLFRTMRLASEGVRDFFDRPDVAISRAWKHGLTPIDTLVNDVNGTMRVLLFQKITENR